MNRDIHPLYSQIVDQLLSTDIRDFQVPLQQRLVTAMNYVHRGNKPSEPDASFKI